MENKLKKLIQALEFQPITYKQGQDLLNSALKVIEKTKGELEQYTSVNMDEVQNAINDIEKVYKELKGLSDDFSNKKDFMMSESYQKQIAKLVKIPVIEKVIEKTETIIEKPVVTNEIVKEITQNIEGEEVVDKINSLPISEENQIDASHIKNLPKANVIRGGVIGIKEVVAGTNVTVDNSNIGYPVVSASGGGSKNYALITKSNDQTFSTGAVGSNFLFDTIIASNNGNWLSIDSGVITLEENKQYKIKAFTNGTTSNPSMTTDKYISLQLLDTDNSNITPGTGWDFYPLEPFVQNEIVGVFTTTSINKSFKLQCNDISGVPIIFAGGYATCIEIQEI